MPEPTRPGSAVRGTTLNVFERISKTTQAQPSCRSPNEAGFSSVEESHGDVRQSRRFAAAVGRQLALAEHSTYSVIHLFPLYPAPLRPPSLSLAEGYINRAAHSKAEPELTFVVSGVETLRPKVARNRSLGKSSQIVVFPLVVSVSTGEIINSEKSGVVDRYNGGKRHPMETSLSKLGCQPFPPAPFRAVAWATSLATETA